MLDDDTFDMVDALRRDCDRYPQQTSWAQFVHTPQIEAMSGALVWIGAAVVPELLSVYPRANKVGRAFVENCLFAMGAMALPKLRENRQCSSVPQDFITRVQNRILEADAGVGTPIWERLVEDVLSDDPARSLRAMELLDSGFSYQQTRFQLRGFMRNRFRVITFEKLQDCSREFIPHLSRASERWLVLDPEAGEPWLLVPIDHLRKKNVPEGSVLHDPEYGWPARIPLDSTVFADLLRPAGHPPDRCNAGARATGDGGVRRENRRGGTRERNPFT